MSTLELKELSAPSGFDLKIAAGKTLDLNSQGTVILPTIPTGKLPTIPYDKLPTGTVIKVLFNTYSTSFSTTATTWIDTGLTITMTPESTTSKVLVEWNQHVYFATSTSVWEGFKFRLLRDGVAVWTDGYAIAHAKYQGNTMDKRSDSWLDSPNTTSSITYSVQVDPYSTANHTFNHGGTTSQIKAMEIVG